MGKDAYVTKLDSKDRLGRFVWWASLLTCEVGIPACPLTSV